MADECVMPAAERAAYANGWHDRAAEVEALKAEIKRLWAEVERLQALYNRQQPKRKKRCALDWSPEEENSLRDLAAKGLTLAGIANALVEEFGKPRTRNAVVSKLKRDGISHAWERVEQGPKPKRKKPKPKPKPRPLSPLSPMLTVAAVSSEPLSEPSSETLVEPSSPPSPSSSPPPDAPAEAVHFIERRNDQCAYPLWDRGYRTGFVCGQPVKTESIFRFCEEHLACCLARSRTTG
jgi:hypothetical protein